MLCKQYCRDQQKSPHIERNPEAYQGPLLGRIERLIQSVEPLVEGVRVQHIEVRVKQPNRHEGCHCVQDHERVIEPVIHLFSKRHFVVEMW